MSSPRNRPVRTAICGIVWLTAACAGASPPGDPWTTWTTLRMKARAAALFTGRVEMRLRNGEADGERRLETVSTARFFGARIAQSRTLSVLDEVTGQPRLYESMSKKSGRRYVFGETGYRVDKLYAQRGTERPLDDWEIHSSLEYPYPIDDEGKPEAVFDYYGMLLHLRRLALEDVGDEALVHVATSKGPTAYRVLVGEIDDIEQTVRDPDTRSDRTFAVRQLRLRILPADPANADEGFLKMEGETEVWVEATSKTLLRISGSVPRVPGRVRLTLTEMGY